MADSLKKLCDSLGVNYRDFGDNKAGMAAAAMSVSPPLIYRDLPVDILKAICKFRNLRTSGNNLELVKRLYDADA
jgi:hypothetical protein